MSVKERTLWRYLLMSEVIITRLNEQNLQETHKLCEKCFKQNVNFDDIKTIYDKVKNDNHYECLVAMLNDKVVGYTTAVVAYNIFDGLKPFMTLWFVCVHPEYRRMYIGTKLFQEIESIAKKRDCELIYFTSEFDNENAHKFYEKLGYNSQKEKAFYKLF